MNEVSFPPDHHAELATTVAHNKTLVKFEYLNGTSPSFCDDYAAALSTYFETKLEQLRLYRREPDRDLLYNGTPGHQGRARGFDEAIAAKIRNLLKWNVQRKTCPPLFAAIGNAETDAKRKQCLVDAFEAVDIPVVFEYITANGNNLITLIQRLGRCRKRQREE